MQVVGAAERTRAHPRRWLLTRTLLAVLCVAACVAPWAGAAEDPAPVLPDLVADSPRWPRVEQYTDAGGNRLLIRFDGFIHNAGAGAADMRGSARVDDEMTSVVQRIYREDGSWYDSGRPGARIRYEPEDGHSHWHLAEAARYSLWNWERKAEVAPAMKVGFCFEDSERVETHGPAVPAYSHRAVRFCEQHEPAIASIFMGISAGWRDIYDSLLAFQWVDVSDVPPGRYWLRAEVDPHDVVAESDEDNPPAFSDDAAPTVPGYAAQAVSAQGLTAGAPAEIALRATVWGHPGAQQFRVESAPAHGDLNVPVGEWFSGSSVTYTPDADHSGSDSFTFSSRDSTSPFPLHPVVATAALGVEGAPESVAISGAPAELDAGTSAQLTALVANGPPGVTWSVNGVPGGDAIVGTIDPSGLYVAPAAPPPGGTATIRATSGGGAFAEAVVRVVAQAAPEPAPGAGPGTGPGPGPGPGTPGPGSPGPGPGPGPGTDAPGSGPGTDAPGSGTPDTSPPGADPPGSGAPAPPPQPVLPPLLAVPRVSVHGRSILVSTVPGRGGKVQMAAMAGKRRVAICRVKVPARRRATCRLGAPRRYRLKSVKVVVKLFSGTRTLATRTARLPKG